MKLFRSLLTATLLLGACTSWLQAEVEVSVDFFHDNLSAYGDWQEVGNYGYCWHPRDTDSSWRPYSDGRWVYTDAGWTWDSDEPYSWAVYHYGRWARLDRVGWVWVPGTEWGPAWVSWRRSSRHVGWAPLPPEARFERSSGFSSHIDVDFDIGPANYNFVEVRNFGAPRLRTVLIEPRENITVIQQTTNITRVTYVNNVVFNGGPQYDVISRESAQPIRRLRLERREQLTGDLRTVPMDQLRPRIEGDTLKVVAVPVSNQPASAPKKVAAKVAAPQINHGWKNAGPPAEVAKVRTKMKSEKPGDVETTTATKQAPTTEVAPAPALSSTPATPVPKPLTERNPKKMGSGEKASKLGKTNAPKDADPANAPAPALPTSEATSLPTNPPEKKVRPTPPVEAPLPETAAPKARDAMPASVEKQKAQKPKTGKENRGPSSIAPDSAPEAPMPGDAGKKSGKNKERREVPAAANAPSNEPAPQSHPKKHETAPQMPAAVQNQPRPEKERSLPPPARSSEVKHPEAKAQPQQRPAVDHPPQPPKPAQPAQASQPAPKKEKGKGKKDEEKKDGQ